MKLLFLIFVLLPTLLFADFKSSYDKLKQKDKDIVEKADKYLADFKTMKSNFIQFSSFDDTLSEGIFYISRNNKLRFEYTNPFRNILITNEKVTTFYDIELDEISTVPTSTTPISFLLVEKQGLRGLDFTILSVKKDENNDIVIRTKNERDGNVYILGFVFDNNISVIKKIDIIDENEQNINLEFFNLEKDIELEQDLFVFKNPRLYKRRK
jgi:outer membrane lipoprotein-sorting protein